MMGWIHEDDWRSMQRKANSSRLTQKSDTIHYSWLWDDVFMCLCNLFILKSTKMREKLQNDSTLNHIEYQLPKHISNSSWIWMVMSKKLPYIKTMGSSVRKPLAVLGFASLRKLGLFAHSLGWSTPFGFQCGLERQTHHRLSIFTQLQQNVKREKTERLLHRGKTMKQTSCQPQRKKHERHKEHRERRSKK